MPIRQNPVGGKRFIACASLAVFLFGAASLYLHNTATAQQIPAAVPESRWQEDLKVFAERFSSGQKDFDKLYPKDQFNQELDGIRKDAPQLSDSEITLRLMRLVASGGVGHTQVSEPRTFHRLPLRFSWFSDGLAVVGALQESIQALGTHVLSIGSMTPQQLEAAVAPYISYENETGLHHLSSQYMRLGELLHYLKVDNADGQVDVTLAKSSGEHFTLTVTPGLGKLGLVNALDALPIPVPLYNKHPGSFYWYEYLPESRTLYIQYNVCANDPKISFSDFTKQMLAATNSVSIERTIVDIQSNGGGDSRIILPLVRALKDRPALSGKGHLYMLIGPATFSSGMEAAIDFRDQLHAILVGEPIGEKPNSYGEIRSFKLPNSGLEIVYCTKFERLVRDSDPESVVPDVLVTRSLADYLAGRDPVLDAAIRHPLQ